MAIASALRSQLSKAIVGIPLTFFVFYLRYIGVASDFLGVFVLASACIWYFCWVVLYYLNVKRLECSAEKAGSTQRKPYSDLLASLSRPSLRQRSYGIMANRFLAILEFLLGDRISHLYRADGSQESSPHRLYEWNSSAFDRCILISLFYPIVAVYVTWGYFGGNHGPAEAALNLDQGVSHLRRVIIATTMLLAITSYLAFCIVGTRRAIIYGWISGALFVITSSSAAGQVVTPNAALGAVSGLFSVVGASLGAKGPVGGVGGIIVAATISVSVVFVDSLVGQHSWLVIFSIIGASLIAPAVVCATLRKAHQLGILGYLQCAIIVTLFLSLNLCAAVLSSREMWRNTGAMLLFFGILSIVNAPFDWVSLALTRRLVRLGLSRYSYRLAIVDLIFSIIIIGFLSAAIILSIQVFDDIAVHWCGKPTLPIKPLILALHESPLRLEFIWIYLIVFTTAAPSLVNLFLANLSLLKGFPLINTYLLSKMPVKGGMAKADIELSALLMNIQVNAALLMTAAGLAILFFGVIKLIWPYVLWEYIYLSNELVSDDVPANVGSFFLSLIGKEAPICSR